MLSKKEPSNLTFHYSLVQGFFWGVYAVLLGFCSLYLLDRGVSNTVIGFVIAIGGTISAILQPTIATYADKPTSPSLKKIIYAISTIVILIGGLLLFFYHRSPVISAIIFSCGIALLQLTTPLVNALGIESMNQGKKMNWGLARGIGSAVYSVVAYILGIVTDSSSTIVIPIFIILGFGFVIFSTAIYPFKKVSTWKSEDDRNASQGNDKNVNQHDARNVEQHDGRNLDQHDSRNLDQHDAANPIDFFRRYRKFCFVLIGAVLIYIGHALLNSFTFQIVQSKGGGSYEMGFSMALSGLIELPTMFLFVYMVKKVRCDIWLRISCLFFTAKVFGTLFAPNIPVFYAVQSFQLLGWALLSVASVHYVNGLMKGRDKIKGQAYFTMTYTIACVLGTLIGGRLTDVYGVNAMLLFAGISSILGTVIVFVFSEKVA